MDASDFFRCINPHPAWNPLIKKVVIPAGCRVFPVNYSNDTIFVDEKELYTSVQSTYSIFRVATVNLSFYLSDLLPVPKSGEYYFVDHCNNSLLGFLVCSDDVHMIYQEHNNYDD